MHKETCLTIPRDGMIQFPGRFKPITPQTRTRALDLGMRNQSKTSPGGRSCCEGPCSSQRWLSWLDSRVHPRRKLSNPQPMGVPGEAQRAVATTHVSSTTPTSIIRKIFTGTSTTVAVTVCIIGIHPKCRSPSTTGSGITITLPTEGTIGATILSWTCSRLRGTQSQEFIPAHRMM